MREDPAEIIKNQQEKQGTGEAKKQPLIVTSNQFETLEQIAHRI